MQNSSASVDMRSFSFRFLRGRIHSTTVIPLLCCTLVFLKGFGSDVLVGSAINRLIERTICRRYYQSHDHYVSLEEIDEKLCKLDPIQTELSLILGTAGFLSPLVELLVAIPLGIYADRWGRKSVLYCNILSGLLYYGWVVVVCFFDNTFKPFDVVACAVFYFIGGGPSIFTAMVLSIVADATPEGSRTTVFYHTQCVVQVVQVLAPLIGSILVTFGIWIPFYLGLSIQLAQFFVVPLLPYTGLEAPKEFLTSEESSLLIPATPPNQRTLNNGHGIHSHNNSSIPPLCPSRRVRIIALATFFVATLGRSVVGILLQYVSLRYNWTLAQAGYLLSLKSFTSMLLFVVILPGVTAYFSKRRGIPVRNINLQVARSSLVLLSAGCTFVGMSKSARFLIPALIVFSLGSGFGAAMQSLITSLSQQNGIAKLYSTISVIETIGSMISHPVLAGALATGIRLGGWSLGLPFFVCAASYMLAAIPLWCISFISSNETRHVE